MNPSFARQITILALTLSIALFAGLSAAHADGEDDGCSASEGWPKPGHCSRTREPVGDQTPRKRTLLAKILCGDEKQTTAQAAESLNEKIAIGNINGDRRRFYFSEVSQPAFSQVGNGVTACVTVRGAWIDKTPGERD